MKLVYTAFVFLLIYFLMFSNGTFPENPEMADARLFLFGIALLLVLSASVFFFEVWNKNLQKGFQPQEVKAKTARTPYQVMRITNTMTIVFIVVVILMIVLVMEYTGNHNTLMQVVEWMSSRSEKILNALLH
jgi:ABC-type Fe3+-siderophore transport system permease subunit